MCRRTIVVLCASLALLAGIARGQAQSVADGADIDPVTFFVMGNVEYILLHELAHLVIRDLDIPIVGPEEGAADYIATAVLIRADLFDAVRAARARQFLLATANGLATAWEYSEQAGDEIRYWDTHSLTIQRFFQVICLVYGSDPEEFSALPGNVGMPPQRAARCGGEYARAIRGLQWLLANYGRQARDAAGAEVELRYETPPTRTSQGLIAAIREAGMIDNTVRRLREQFTLKEPFSIVFRACRERQAAWLPEQRELVFCYELLDSYFLLGRSNAARSRPQLP